MAAAGPNTAARRTRRHLLKGVAAVGSAVALARIRSVCFGSIAEAASSPPSPPNFPTDLGQHYTETRGGAPYPNGYAILKVYLPLYSLLGSYSVLGYPVSNPFSLPKYPGFEYVALQNGVMQRNLTTNEVTLCNILDMMHDNSLDAWLNAQGVPNSFTGDDGSAGDFQKAKQVRLSWLTDSAISTRYYSIGGDPVAILGLPTSTVRDMGAFRAQRFQRAAVLEWVQTVPGGQPIGTVGFANIGDLAKSSGFIPKAATVPSLPSNSAPPASQTPGAQKAYPPEFDLPGGSKIINLDPRYGITFAPDLSNKVNSNVDSATNYAYVQNLFTKYGYGKKLEITIRSGGPSADLAAAVPTNWPPNIPPIFTLYGGELPVGVLALEYVIHDYYPGQFVKERLTTWVSVDIGSKMYHFLSWPIILRNKIATWDEFKIALFTHNPAETRYGNIRPTNQEVADLGPLIIGNMFSIVSNT